MKVNAAGVKKNIGHFLQVENETDKVYEGYCVDVALEIASIVNFKFIFKQVKDAAYGAEDENGTWNGMVGELLRNVRRQHRCNQCVYYIIILISTINYLTSCF